MNVGGETLDIHSRKAILGSILAGFVGGVALATTWQFAPQTDGWTVLSALGTVGATAAAVTIAVSDQIRRHREGEVHARIAVGSLLPEIEYILAGLDAARTFVRDRLGQPVTATTASNLADIIEQMQVLHPAQATALTEVSKDAAITFAHAIARLGQLKRSLALIKDDFAGPLLTDDQRQTELNRWIGVITFIHDALNAVYTDCAERLKVGRSAHPATNSPQRAAP
ncbi:hypothetical protein B551_0222625 [Cupriavidus sp. HPC(L)]|uniref:hypothetical protein n=1 Tax=Cupriavidus sp. HPC(L) TaxID=1217418 RepID=UPI0002915E1C|nr:hypothetical protein [Cupriavidus sp. HPC(L)]ESH90769.1 hypothetical protein B551_0222625 [Cupriavidus sp. HPC(L)]